MPTVKVLDATAQPGTILADSRYIEVWSPAGEYVSRHLSLRECYQSIFNYATANNVGGSYRCIYPEDVITIELTDNTVGSETPAVEQLELFSTEIGVAVS